MPIYYLDTSALLKRYKTEAGSQVLAELFNAKATDETLASSYYTILEVSSVARRLLKGRVVNRRTYNALMARFLDDADNLIVVQPVTDDVITRAIQVAERHALRPGDAVQLAAALLVTETIPAEQFVLVASDRELCEASAAAEIEVLNPEYPGALSLLQSIRARS